MYLKDTAYRSERWLRAVASLPCMRCFREGSTQAAHRDFGKGIGIKTDDCFTAALCVACHAELGQGKEYTRAQKREMMDAYILQTVRALAKEGLVKPA